MSVLHQKAIYADKILSMLGQAVVSFDANGAVTYLNPHASLLLDVLAQEVVGKKIDTILQITVGKTLPLEDGIIAKTVLQSGKPFSASLYKKTFWLTNASGRQYPVSLVVTPISFGGASEGGIAIFRDITEEEKLRLEAQKARRRLEALKTQKKEIEKLKELDRLKDNFLNNTTHELKTPLIPIKSQVQLLLAEDYGSLNEEQKKSIEMIARNEGHLEGLVSDVVDITKIRSGKLKLVKETVNLTDIITMAVQDFQMLAKERGITLRLQLGAAFPTLTLDAKRIGQVISNLLNNALKFIPLPASAYPSITTQGLGEATAGKQGYGGQAPQKGKVTVEVKREKDNVVVSVRDNGIGMSKKTLAKLFTPFFQAQSDEARKYGGTGLGLAISKGFVEAHRGTITAESEGEGKGSTITFTLPLSS